MPRKQTKEEFINKSKSIFGSKLNYSLVDYINSKTPVRLICNSHGEFSIAPKDHISYKRGCKVCTGRFYSNDEYIKAAHIIHNNKFDYSKVKFKNIKNKIIVICNVHGEFSQSAEKHLYGQGCPKCSKNSKKNFNYYMNIANETHGNYNYSKSEFIDTSSKIEIICKYHGSFFQTVSNHIYGKQGCPSCKTSVSKKETMWLDSLNVPEEFRQAKIFTTREYLVDAYDPRNNTVYEFDGDYWHGNPDVYNSNDINDVNGKSFGYLYEKTIRKQLDIINSGFNLIKIWENDFK